MNNWMEKFQDKLLPIATKIANQKFLIALRNAFIGTMPVVMAGSIAILLNAFLVDFPMQFGFEGITESFQWLVDINNLIFSGSLAVVSLLFIFSLGVNVARVYKVDELSSGLVAFAAFILSIGNSMTINFDLNNVNNYDLGGLFEGIDAVSLSGDSIAINATGLLPGASINTRGYFAAIIIGFIASIIFSKIMLKDWTIKLPDSVPPAISKPFLSIIPGLISLYAVGVLIYLFNLFTDQNLVDWIYAVLQEPLLGLSQSWVTIALIAILVQLFWFFGLHGGNVMALVMEGLFGVTLLANMEAFQNGEAIPYIWTSVTYAAFVFNATVGLVIAIFLVSKNPHYREVAKLGAVPTMFNIGEPITYGLPVVLNPIMFIPRVFAPAVLAMITYAATALGWVSPITQNVTWVMPPVLYGFFATGFDWRAIVLSIVNLTVATLFYLPFVKLADNQYQLEEEAKRETEGTTETDKETVRT